MENKRNTILSDKNVIIVHEDRKRQQLVHIDRIKQYFLPKYDYESRSAMEGNQNDKNSKEKESAQTEKQKSIKWNGKSK